MKKHEHRIASPKRYPILKKEAHYVIKLGPGPHSKKDGLPLLLLLRDLLKISRTRKETEKILNTRKILVDKRVVKDVKLPVGLMDSITISDDNYRFLYNTHGDVKLVKIDDKESSLKICKIKDKSTVKGGKLQLNLHDGRNLLVDSNEHKPGDSILISLPNQEINKHLPCKKGMLVYITDGKHIGEIAEIYEFIKSPGSNPDRVILKLNENKFETLKKYLFVIGESKPELNLGEIYDN